MMKTCLCILFLSITFYTLGQNKADQELTHFLKKQKLDTFLLLKKGCHNCKISYEHSLKSVDTMTIFLLYKRAGQITLITFSDTGKTRKLDNLKTDIFQFITANRHGLKQADSYYQEQKHAKFQAPCLVTFPYEKIQAQVGQFRHEHTVVDIETDDCGTYLANEEWFKAELEILTLFDRIKQTN